jgi:mRNA interferase RelE/StbE
MACEIVFAASALADYKAIDARRRAAVKQAIEVHLRNVPTRTSRSRIMRLRGMRRPQFRLRVESMRVFYDVDDDLRRVEVLRIIDKQLADTYLSREGVKDETNTTVQGEG